MRSVILYHHQQVVMMTFTIKLHFSVSSSKQSRYSLNCRELISLFTDQRDRILPC